MNNFNDEETKYRKKSKAKGQPRSKHKHMYEVVLLNRHFTISGNPRIFDDKLPTKVCTICGRIDDVVWDDEYYVGPKLRYPRVLSEKALNLNKWHCDFLDKFAVKDE